MGLKSGIVGDALEMRRLIKSRKIIPEERDPAELVLLIALFDVARDKIIHAHREDMINVFDGERDRCRYALATQTYGMSIAGFLEIEKASCALLRDE